jgi:hypothetical protein
MLLLLPSLLPLLLLLLLPLLLSLLLLLLSLLLLPPLIINLGPEEAVWRSGQQKRSTRVLQPGMLGFSRQLLPPGRFSDG